MSDVLKRKKIKMDEYLAFADSCRNEYLQRSTELQNELRDEFDKRLQDFLQGVIICRDEEFD